MGVDVHFNSAVAVPPDCGSSKYKLGRRSRHLQDTGRDYQNIS